MDDQVDLHLVTEIVKCTDNEVFATKVATERITCAKVTKQMPSSLRCHTREASHITGFSAEP